MRKVSLKMHKRLNRYRRIKAEFIEGKDCAVCGRPATQIHHARGRLGDKLFETEHFVPVCSNECHEEYERHEKLYACKK